MDWHALFDVVEVVLVAFGLVVGLVGYHHADGGVRRSMRGLAVALGGSVSKGGRSVEAHRDGRRVRVGLGESLVERTSSAQQGLVYEVEVPGARALLLERASDARAWARAGAHGQEAHEAIDYLWGIGIERLAVKDGWLLVRRASSGYALGPARVKQVLDALLRLAPLLERRSLTIRVGGAERAGMAWAVGERVLCPFCRDVLGADSLEACAECATVHHAECLVEGGGCSVFGCAGRGGAERVSATRVPS